MTYRKIEVHGKEYEYVIGGSNIHIRGFGDFPVKVHGNRVYYPRGEDDTEGQKTGEYIATPATVRALILGKETPVYVAKGEKRLMRNPFAAEIYEKTEYLPYNPVAYYSLRDDI